MPASKVVATVGEKEITSGQIEAVIKNANINIPADKMDMVRQRVLDQMIVTEFMKAYLVSHKITCSDEELASEKAMIDERAKMMGMTGEQLLASKGITDEIIREKVSQRKLIVQATTQPVVDQLVKEHPEFVDGTKVSASHVLISCSMYDSQEKQQEALKKSQEIAAEIKAGKISFEDAAKQYSSCPSKDKGGELGEFEYGQMVPAFSAKAFSMKAGEISEPVQSQFGYHIIQVNARNEPTTQPAEKNVQDQAKNVLMGQLQEQIVSEGLVKCPVVLKN